MSLLLGRLLSLSVFVLFLATAFFPDIADAAGLVPCGGRDEDPCTLCHLFIGINNVLTWGRNILVSVAFLAIVVAGIIYIVSAGSQQTMEMAKTMLKQALIGFVVVLGAWLIVNTVMNLISTRSDLGVNATSWSEFECSTEARYGN
ncbi:pilin [Patescibacteria group bacterium]